MNIYKRLLLYITPYKGRLIGAIICMWGYAFTVGMVSVIPYITISGLSNKDEVVIGDIPHVPQLEGLSFPSWWIPIFIITIVFLRSLFEYISRYQMASVGIRAVRKVRDDLYGHLVGLSRDFYSKGRTGDMLSRIMNDVSSIQGAVTDVLTDIVKQPLVVLINVPMIFIWGGPNAFCAVIVFPLVAIPIAMLGKRLRKVTKSMQERAADITSFIGETLVGMHVVQAFNREEDEAHRFRQLNKKVFDFFKKSIKVTIVQRPLIETMGGIGAALAIWFAMDDFSPERFTAFVTSLFLLYEPLKKLSKVNSTIQQSIAAGTRIFEILDTEPSIKNKPDAIVFKDPIETVTFEDVEFAYEEGIPVLRDISIAVKRGEVMAFVGRSGSGKTTLVSLLPRFYDPVKGRVMINGKDIRDLSLHSLRSQIAIVSQETVLFNGSVAENIAYGVPDAPQEEILRAAQAAHAHEFIEKMPEGYETQLGERGTKLSGGQRQRIAIARALLKDSPILILDEATSHLDTNSERLVQEALDVLMRGRTVFVIAHRLSTIKKADRILVVEDGRIIQEGTNEALLADGGEYKSLYDLQ